jgi:hypothetical protein
MTTTVRTSTSLVRRLGGGLAAALVLSVPAFAVGALTTSAGAPAVPIAAEDDPIARGFRTAEAPREQAAAPARADDGAGSAVLLRNWAYTGKPHPSPGH